MFDTVAEVLGGAAEVQYKFKHALESCEQRGRQACVTGGPANALSRFEAMKAIGQPLVRNLDDAEPRSLTEHDLSHSHPERARVATDAEFGWRCRARYDAQA